MKANMDHVQQILLQQLQGQTPGQVTTGRNQRTSSNDSSNSDGSNSVSDLAAKARQWAEKQKQQIADQDKRVKQQQSTDASNGLQGWKNEHPSWFGLVPVPMQHIVPYTGEIIRAPLPQMQVARPSFAPPLLQQTQPRLQVPLHETLKQFSSSTSTPSPNHSNKKHRKNRHTQNRHQQHDNSGTPGSNRRNKQLGTFPDFDEADSSKNLPKWMRDEITRIQHQKSHTGEDPIDLPVESNISELQKLVDEDSDGESSEDDWKIEGRKLSEDLAKANDLESDPELSDAEEVAIPTLTQDVKDSIKNEILASSIRSILLEVTDELTGKISRNVISKASAGQATKQSNALGGLIGYGYDSDDSDVSAEQGDNDDDGGDSDTSISSEAIRRKRKVFDRKQKRRLDKLRKDARGSGDDVSDESEPPSQERGDEHPHVLRLNHIQPIKITGFNTGSTIVPSPRLQSSSRYSSPARRSPSSKRKRSRSRNRSKSRSNKSRRRTRSRSRSRRSNSRSRSRSNTYSSRSHRSYSREESHQ